MKKPPRSLINQPRSRYITFVPLANGKGTAIIDRKHAASVGLYNWAIVKSRYTDYAITFVGKKGLYLHRLIASLEGIESPIVDHRDRNGLDCRRKNLRAATRSQNGHHQKRRQDNTSGYRGVARKKGRWRAQIQVNGKKIHVGGFETALAAAHAYDALAVAHFGEFGALNFPGPEKTP